MTLNDLEWPFTAALKSVLESACHGLHVPAFSQNCSEICGATHIQSASIQRKNVARDLVSGDITLCGYSLGYLKRES